jgi:spore maturation protein CgeB
MGRTFTTKTFGLRDMREQLGVTRAGLLPHAYDPDLHRPVELTSEDRDRYGCDVSFIGTWSPKKETVLATLCERRPSLRVRAWGEQWQRATSRALSRAIAGHEVVGEEYARAIRASTINLAVLSERRAGASDGDQITSRTFHIPACGAFMLHERTAELLGLFREDESVACYDGVEELVAQVDRYLADATRRTAVAARGHEVVTAAHSWDVRIRAILDHHAAATA